MINCRRPVRINAFARLPTAAMRAFLWIYLLLLSEEPLLAGPSWGVDIFPGLDVAAVASLLLASMAGWVTGAKVTGTKRDRCLWVLAAGISLFCLYIYLTFPSFPFFLIRSLFIFPPATLLFYTVNLLFRSMRHNEFLLAVVSTVAAGAVVVLVTVFGFVVVPDR